MARITLSSRFKTGQELAAVLDSFARRLALGVEREFFGSTGEEPGELPLERLVQGARQKLLAAREALLERHRAVRCRAWKAREARRQRDDAVAEVRAVLVQLRKVVTGLWGPGGVPEILGLRRWTSEDPVVLLRQAREVRDALLEQAELPEGERPVPLLPAEMDFRPFAARLETVADQLEARLAEALGLQKEEEAAVVARRRAAREFDDVYRSTRAWLRSLFALAGMGDLALLADVEPRRPRPRRPEAATAPAAGEAPERDGQEAPAAARPAVTPRAGGGPHADEPASLLHFPQPVPGRQALPP